MANVGCFHAAFPKARRVSLPGYVKARPSGRAGADAAGRDQPERGAEDGLPPVLRSGLGTRPLFRAGHLYRWGVRVATHRSASPRGLRAHSPLLTTGSIGGLSRVARRSRDAPPLQRAERLPVVALRQGGHYVLEGRCCRVGAPVLKIPPSSTRR